MCVVSAVYDYGSRQPDHWWDRQKLTGFQDLIKKANAWDQMVKQPDCEDPAKAEWMKKIEERLRKLEEAK